MSSTHFGFRQVPTEKKEPMVQKIFSDIANNYDLMNDLMSLGMHHLWKDELINELRPGLKLLDAAGGTGDISRRFVSLDNIRSAVVCDLNKNMLKVGQDRLIDDNFAFSDRIEWIHGNIEELPFNDSSFDLYSVSFGIRNVTNIDKALSEAYRVLKTGGKFVCLEFSDISNPLFSKLYDIYSMKWIPKLGSIIASDKEAYQYLVESIRKFPNAPLFCDMIKDAGFKEAWFKKKTFGIVAIHIAYKL